MSRPVPAHTVSVSIARTPRAVYAYAGDPRNLPAWAPGFARSAREQDGRWLVETADGPVEVRFAPDNDFGVLDHQITGPGLDVVARMRVLPNGAGAELIFTLFQQDGVSDEQFARDVELVSADLRLLRRVLENELE